MSIFRGTGGSGSSSATSVIIPVSQGGTGATTIAEARLNINAAKNGVNSDITQLLGLEQPLSVAQGGTGSKDASVARTNLGAASSAQGALADTALQEADVATVALTGSYNDLLDIPTAGTGDVVGPTSSTDGAVALFDGTTGKLLKDGVVLGTAATTDATVYATAAQGALADSALQSSAIGVSVQAYNANTVVDASYVHTDNNYTTTEKTKLSGIAEGAEVNVNADWNAVRGDAQILNKPPLGTAAATDSTAYATAAQGTKADTAYGWGNHASAGYLTSYTETDPVYTASTWYSTTNNASNWNTAYGWGNHASAGYATNLDGLSDVTISTPSTDQVLKYNGSGWVNAAAPAGGQYLGTATTKAIAYTSQTIAENLSLTSGTSGLSAGPVTISSGYSVTIPSGCRWVIV